MSVDINLPETAKALAAPVTKLIEVVAAGCGRLYDPTDIRRRAIAEGDALVILEEAKSRATDVAVRAAQRLIDMEERRQENIDAITREAAQLLPSEVSEVPVDPDWAARFFGECQDVRNEEMRTVWAKLLAGEVATPGTFSQRTLSVVRNLGKTEAEYFNVLCKMSFRGVISGVFVPLFNVGNMTFWEDFGFNFLVVQSLVDAGLVHNAATGLAFKNATRIALRGPVKSLLFESDTPRTLNTGNVSLTTAGSQLAQICEWDIPEEQFKRVKDAGVGIGFQASEIVITETNESGEFSYRQFVA